MEQSIKNILLFTLVIILTFQGCSPSRNINLSGKTFICEEYSRISSLEFLNDSICFYTQQYKCDILDKYKNVKFKCSYQYSNDLIYVKNIEPKLPTFLDLKNYNCFSIPEEDLLKCNIIKEDFIKNMPEYLIIDRPPSVTLVVTEGYINNFDLDIFYYKENALFYNKGISCMDFYFISKKVFMDDKRKKVNRKKIERIFKSNKVPLNG